LSHIYIGYEKNPVIIHLAIIIKQEKRQKRKKTMNRWNIKETENTKGEKSKTKEGALLITTTDTDIML
jgi:hypothetical protein